MTALLDPLIAGLWTRVPVLVLAALPALLLLAVSTVFHGVQLRLAGHDPHELPEAAGPWARARADALGLTSLRVHRSPAFSMALDALIPTVNALVLRPATFEARDPVAWAIAAHELGHALHVRHPAWSLLFQLGRAAAHALGRLMVAALLVLVVTGSTTAHLVALVLLGALLLAQALVLADEAWASLTAHHLLVADGRLDTGQLRRARGSLSMAFIAHVAGSLGLLITAALWPLLVAPIRGPWVPLGAPLPWPTLVFLAALTLPLLKRAIRLGTRLVAPHRVRTLTEAGRRAAREDVGDLAGGLGALILVGAALSLPASPWRDVSLVLAAAPALVPVTGILQGVAELPVRILLGEVGRLARPPDPPAPGVPPHPAPPDRKGTYGSPLLTLELMNEAGPITRALSSLRIAYLPLLIAFWTVEAARLPARWAAGIHGAL